MAALIPDNNAAILVPCDLTDLIDQLPEGQDKTSCRRLNSYIEGLKNVLSSRQGCSDAVLAIDNLQRVFRQLLITVINDSNPDINVIRLQSQEVCTALRNTIAVMRANHPDEFDQVYMGFQHLAGIEDQRVNLQQGCEDLVECLVPFYENLEAEPETRPASQPQICRSSPFNPTPETERTPLLGPGNVLNVGKGSRGTVSKHQGSPNITERKKKALKIAGGVLVAVTAGAGLLAGVALLCTGVGAPVGAAVIGADVGITMAIVGGVTAVTAGGVAVGAGTAAGVAWKKGNKK